MSEPEDDPDAPLPPDAPPHVRAFYDTVASLLSEISASDPAAGNDLMDIWTWMTMHIPERFLRPKPSE